MRHYYKPLLVTASLILIITAVAILHETAFAPTGAPKAPATKPVDSFDKSAYSTTDPTSIWVIVNKQHPLTPKNYVPPKLVIPTIAHKAGIGGDEQYVSAVMAPALERMTAAAKDVGLTLTLESGYRSYNLQTSLYASYVRSDSQANADRYSARPGYSEHQTGFAADLGGASQPGCNVAACYAETTEGKWLAVHAYQYGFIIRYTTAKESITGYENEPWHVRYVGTALANELHKEHVLTLEEFFGVLGGTTYKTTH